MIFISYAREDEERAKRIYDILSRYGHEVFFDKVDLLPGMDWRQEIEAKIDSSTLVLLICSANSTRKMGFVQKELRLVVDRAQMMPEGKIYVVPVRFDNVEMPTQLKRYQWIEISSEVDYHNLQFFFDAIIRKSKEMHPDQPDAAKDTPTIARHLMREEIVILMQGQNASGDKIYSYLKTPIWKFYELTEFVKNRSSFVPSEYGVIVATGTGDPPIEVRERMKREHNLIDIPHPSSGPVTLSEPERQAFRDGFDNTYKCLNGDDSIPPPYTVPIALAYGQSALREGIRLALAGLRKNRQSPSRRRKEALPPSSSTENEA